MIKIIFLSLPICVILIISLFHFKSYYFNKIKRLTEKESSIFDYIVNIFDKNLWIFFTTNLIYDSNLISNEKYNLLIKKYNYLNKILLILYVILLILFFFTISYLYLYGNRVNGEIEINF